ncbi:MAG: isopeptide-forming domain-containing fimbrial protein [Lachnospiraceae bacterium]|nr:isopeptide-forming domain-containing fimbrial protein [Lachnospiraceae bacterium]
MKKLKKAAGMLFALALALVTLLGTGTAVRAEETTSATGNSLTITNTGDTAHTFELYQIFTGDLIVDPDTGTKTLSNVQWGDGVTTEGQNIYGKASQEAEKLTSDNVKSFADQLIDSGYLQNKTVSGKIDSGSSHTFDHLSAGYYLVVDVASSQTYDETVDERKSAYTAYIFQVVGSVKLDTKIDVPTISKYVYNNNDSVSEAVKNPQDVEVGDWHDMADHDVGDSIPYHIVGTLPSNYDEYETYKTYTITDKLSDGLTPPDKSNVKVCLSHLDSDNNVKISDITDKFDISVSEQTLTVALKKPDGDMKKITGNATDTIEVFYNAILNEHSVIGGDGNPNTVNLQYSNNPNQGGEGDKGKTPDDRNVVFTYQLNVNKFKENQDESNKTDEATFKLFKEMKNGDAQVVPIIIGTDKTYMASRLDDGKYILQETKAPDGYNKMDGTVKFGEKTYENAVEFEIKPEYDDGQEPKVTNLEAAWISGATVKFNSDLTAGAVTTDIIDQKGSSLPSTGGIGTTIFYVIGSVLVIGAGVLLVTRRRMNKKS